MHIGIISRFHGGFLGAGMSVSVVRKCGIGKQFSPSVPSPSASLQQLHLLIYQLNLGPLRGADVLFVIQN